MNDLKTEEDGQKTCPVFSFLRLEKKERESREQYCQSTETTTNIHFRTMHRSVGSGSCNSSDFFLSPFSLCRVQKRRKKKEVIVKGDVDLNVYAFE